MTQTVYQYLESLCISEESASVDAVTITATGLGGKLTIGFIMDKFSEELLVEEERPFTFNGASGFSRGPVRYAAKWDNLQRQIWSILMVTGGISDRLFSEAIAYDPGDLKFTRIDLCVDVKLCESVTELAKRIYLARANMETVSYIASFTGDTVYFGKRTSARFARIYDKSMEYNEPRGTVWRFELEAKKELAHNIALQLGDARMNTSEQCDKEIIQDIVWAQLRELGSPTPKRGDFPNILSSKVTLSSNEMKLNWLRSKVRKTVKHLVRAGYAEQVQEALGVQLSLEL